VRRAASLPDGTSDDEDMRRLEERWKFDSDDGPGRGPYGADEHDRILVDNYECKRASFLAKAAQMFILAVLRYITHTLKLLADGEQHSLLTDPSIPVPTPEGRYQTVIPFRMGAAMLRHDPGGTVRPYPPPGVLPQGQPSLSHPPPPPVPNGTSVAIQHQVKTMLPPINVPQIRILSNGGICPPVIPPVTSLQAAGNNPTPAVPSVAPQLPPIAQHDPTPAITNRVGRAAMTMPHVKVIKVDGPVNGAVVNGPAPIPQPEAASQTHEAVINSTPSRLKSQNQLPILPPNGYHLYSAALANPAFAQYMIGQSLTIQQMQNIKAAFDLASMQPVAGRLSYMHLANARNMNMPLSAMAASLKLPATQPWPTGSPLQRPASTVNGVNGVDAHNLSASVSPTNTPVRTPSANGTQNAINAPRCPSKHPDVNISPSSAQSFPDPVYSFAITDTPAPYLRLESPSTQKGMSRSTQFMLKLRLI
jgi:enhancer of polycomb-like protein